MRKEVVDRRQETYSGGREIEITIGGSVSEGDFDSISGRTADEPDFLEIYTREILRKKNDGTLNDDAAYTQQLLRESEEQEKLPDRKTLQGSAAKEKFSALTEAAGNKIKNAADKLRQTAAQVRTDAKLRKKVLAAAGAVLAVLAVAAGITVLNLPGATREQPVLPAVSSSEVPEAVVVSLTDSVPAFESGAYNCTMTFPLNAEVIEIADGLMADKLFVRHTIEPEVYNINNIDWDIKAKNSPNTFQLYLHSLNPIIYLVKACEITGDTAYLARAEQFIASWDKYRIAEGENSENTFLWNDHGTAIRAENLIYYYFAAEKYGCLKEETARYIADILVRHAEFLYDDENYTENHNHGIFQDRALIYIAFFLNNEKFDVWTQKAVSRLEEQKNFAFTTEMVHVENSPNYQLGVMETFRVISEFLMQFQTPYGDQFFESITNSAKFMTYIIKPNGCVAEIGDTDGKADIHKPVKMEKGLDFGNDNLSYSCTLGEQGTAPENSAVFYPVSGYYIYRASWAAKDYTKSTWSMFKSGYSSGTHKHADDNSFMLYTAGYDVFVDPGYYNYMQGDWYSDYFASAAAHNTVIVDGGGYSPTAENSHLTGIYDYSDGENYDYVLGVNDMYAGVSHDRHFYNLGEAIIIHDDISADESHTYSQLFHLGETAEIISQSGSEVLIKLGETGRFVRIRQFGAPCELSVINGNDEGAQMGFISRQLNCLDTIDTLKFDAKGEDVSFVTLITIENKRGKTENIRRIRYEDGVFTVKTALFTKEYAIELRQRQRVEPSAVTAVQDGNAFVFTNQNSKQGLEFAWEILNSSGGEPVYVSEFSAQPVLRYEFDRKGTYMVRAIVRDGSLERKAVVAAIRADDNGCTDITDQYPHLELRYHGHSVSGGDGSYTFRVNFDYSWDYSIKWYIYRDGAYFDAATTYSNEWNYTFTQPAEYTVIYYLRTAGGNNELWNFPAITVK